MDWGESPEPASQLARWLQYHRSRFPPVLTACARQAEGADSRYRSCYRPGVPLGGGARAPKIPKIGRVQPRESYCSDPLFFCVAGRFKRALPRPNITQRKGICSLASIHS